MTASSSTLLFIGSQFFGYERDIILRLEQLGWKVDFYSDCPPNKFLFKVLKKIAKPVARRWCDSYFSRLFKSLSGQHYDRVFVLKGEGLTQRTTMQLRQLAGNAPMALYQWDSVRNLPFGAEKLNLFDRVLSFDPVDVARWPKMQHHPLFFVDTFATPAASSQDIDLLFVGTLRSDRFRIVTAIRNSLPEDIKCEFKFYVPKRLMYEMGRLPGGPYHGLNQQEVIFKPISKSEISSLTARSRVIIDIEHEDQTGLTMRTFETLGANRKLATTNTQVKNYSFYDPRNICVLERSHPEVTIDFIRAPMALIEQATINGFSLPQWINNVVLK